MEDGQELSRDDRGVAGGECPVLFASVDARIRAGQINAHLAN
jgi:hypothetical protein